MHVVGYAGAQHCPSQLQGTLPQIAPQPHNWIQMILHFLPPCSRWIRFWNSTATGLVSPTFSGAPRLQFLHKIAFSLPPDALGSYNT